MVRLKMGKGVAIVKEEAVLMQDNVGEDASLVLQKLSNEEANLIEERKNLASLREKLQMKIRKRIKQKKNNIQKLRDEIKELKFSCEELTKTLKAGT